MLPSLPLVVTLCVEGTGDGTGSRQVAGDLAVREIDLYSASPTRGGPRTFHPAFMGVGRGKFRGTTGGPGPSHLSRGREACLSARELADAVSVSPPQSTSFSLHATPHAARTPEAASERLARGTVTLSEHRAHSLKVTLS